MEQADARVLVVDDDPAVGKVLGGLLSQDGMASVHVLSAAEGLGELTRAFFDVVITDLQMPGMDGMEFLRRVRGAYPEIPVIMITAHGSVPVAVEAMKAGASDFVLKPFERQELLDTVRNWVAAAAGQAERSSESTQNVETLMGVGPKMKEAKALLRKAANGNTTVLLRGETGVGKDVAAHMVHEESRNRNGPFVTVSCAALPEGLLESELFGSKKGAYNNAVDRPGRVELAAGGTLFLDEIGDLTLTMQVKLLRLLQDRTFERLGDARARRADVRFIAATHRNLEARVSSGEFREDLFYRLNVLPVWIPPLRERPEEIEPLAVEFCTTFGREANRPGLRLAPDALALLRQQPWRGNVRQLRNFMERLAILADGDVIAAADVAHELQRQMPLADRDAGTPPTPLPGQPAFPGLDSKRSEAEHDHIVSAMQRALGNRTVAAKLLGISRRTLYNKLHQLGMLGPPTVDVFSAAPTALPVEGGRTVLSWAVRNATRIRLEPVSEDVTVLSGKEVTVNGTTTFQLLADNEQGQTVQTLTVTVGS
jgi:two-component system, NtrC family, response regulator AtoC